MRAVVQRVSNARVDIDGATAGSIGRGLLILLGVGHDDSEEQAERLWSTCLAWKRGASALTWT